MNTRAIIDFTFLYPSPEGQYEAMLALPYFLKKGGFPIGINGLIWFSRGVSSYSGTVPRSQARDGNVER
jgi:hypothetical protein